MFHFIRVTCSNVLLGSLCLPHNIHSLKSMITARTGTMHCKLRSVPDMFLFTISHNALKMQNANFNSAHTLYELSE